MRILSTTDSAGRNLSETALQKTEHVIVEAGSEVAGIEVELDRLARISGQVTSSDTGYFWFFEPENVEVIAKVLDACNSAFDSY